MGNRLMMLVLASASPRRRELLALINGDFICAPVAIDETPHPGEQPDDYVLRLAKEKGRAAFRPGTVTLSADTTVALNMRILGKPASRADARDMLMSLSGVAHDVFTAIAVTTDTDQVAERVASRVEFDSLHPALIEQYLDTEEPWDKAGAYGIQGLAGCFVKRLAGSYSAVVGLPLCETRQLLARFDIPLRWPVERND